MANSFQRHEIEYGAQRDRLAGLESRAGILKAPDVDPLKLSAAEFDVYRESKDRLINYVISDGATREAEFQLQVTTNALEKVRNVIRLLEAQRALHSHLLPHERGDVARCLSADETQLSIMFLKAGDSVRQMNGSAPVQEARLVDNLDEEMQLFIAPLFNEIGNEVNSYLSNKIDVKYLVMPSSMIVETIGKLRLEAVGDCLAANDLHMNKIELALEHVTYVAKARDENIIPASQEVQSFIDDKLAYVSEALTRANERLDAAGHYMDRIYDMGNPKEDLAKFRARTYNAAPLALLFDNTP